MTRQELEALSIQMTEETRRLTNLLELILSEMLKLNRLQEQNMELLTKIERHTSLATYP